MHVKLTEEFVEVSITKGIHTSTEYHAAAIRRDGEKFQRHNQGSLNIAMIMFESQSHSNVQRYMKKTYAWLKNDPNTHIFKGRTIVGDATTPQLLAMLANLEESQAPEARRGYEFAQPIDNYPFIFKELKKDGYVTAYAEDDPVLGTFQVRLLGFRDQPTDKYLRTFWLKAFDSVNETHVRCIHQLSFGYLKKFFSAYSKEKKFIFVNNSPIGHEKLNTIALADEDTYYVYQFLQDGGFLNNTVVMLFGDHGFRTSNFRGTKTGRMEERLPFLSITVPEWFRTSNTKYHQHLMENQNILTTPFDMYATIRHIMNLRTKKTKYDLGASLLSPIDPKLRTCITGGVPLHFCPCPFFTKTSINSDKVVLVGKKVVEKINKLICESKESCRKCSMLTLKKVVKANKRITTQRRGRVSKKVIYEIVLETEPSGALFEATALARFNDIFEITNVYVSDGAISRINSYRDQPECVAKKFPHLKKYCFCK